jgi:O-glycosyl hydrolase
MPGRSFAFEPLEQRVLCASIAVNLSQTYQTIAGLGGNYARAKYGDFFIESNDKVGQYTLANLQPKHARIGIPLRGWEPVNDDADPNSMNMAGFATTNTTVIGVFQLMQDLNSRGIPITASVWDAPGWMVTDPTLKNQRVIPSSLYPEFIESIASFLKRADETYGVKVDYLSLNEADGGFNLKFSATQQASLIKLAGPLFSQLGLSYTPKWLVGDTGNASRLVNYATPILSDPGAAPYLGPISFHGWDSLTYPDSTLTAIAALGQQYNKPIWCEEVGYDAAANVRTPLPFPAWDYAIKTAQVYNRVITLAGVSVADYWEFDNDFPLLQTGPTVLYPAYYVTQTELASFTPGEQMVAANSDTASILSMAATDGPSGRVVLQAINTAATDQTVTFSGLPTGIMMSLIRSSATENAVNLGTLTAGDGTITLTLPASSICTFSGIRPASARPPTQDPTPIFPPPGGIVPIGVLLPPPDNSPPDDSQPPPDPLQSPPTWPQRKHPKPHQGHGGHPHHPSHAKPNPKKTAPGSSH